MLMVHVNLSQSASPLLDLICALAHEPAGETQVHEWLFPILTKFRELELQLLAGRLAVFFGGIDSFIKQTSA